MHADMQRAIQDAPRLQPLATKHSKGAYTPSHAAQLIRWAVCISVRGCDGGQRNEQITCSSLELSVLVWNECTQLAKHRSTKPLYMVTCRRWSQHWSRGQRNIDHRLGARQHARLAESLARNTYAAHNRACTCSFICISSSATIKRCFSPSDTPCSIAFMSCSQASCQHAPYTHSPTPDAPRMRLRARGAVDHGRLFSALSPGTSAFRTFFLFLVLRTPSAHRRRTNNELSMGGPKCGGAERR